MLTLHTQEIHGQRCSGLLFHEQSRNAFFFDFHGQYPGHTKAPGPSYRVLFNDQIYHLSEIHPGFGHRENFPRPEVKELLLTPDGKWLQDCAILVEQLEYPTYQMGGKESQCLQDQKSITNIGQYPEKQLK